MTSNLKLSEAGSETGRENTPGLHEAVKAWVCAAGDADTEVLLRELNKTVIEAVMEAETDHHLGYLSTTRPATGRVTPGTEPGPRG